MNTVEIAISPSTSYRATEVVADLRNAVEAIYFPMKSVGYWDTRTGDHRCPQAQLGGECPHLRETKDPKYIDYATTVERDLNGVLSVYFPHAQVHIYLS
ncbi:hypothetical protein M1O29_02700 [Dehalococcoidia bacterium]|nr:hypothetical protein [Dehalococcoidia bacterium]